MFGPYLDMIVATDGWRVIRRMLASPYIAMHYLNRCLALIARPGNTIKITTSYSPAFTYSAIDTSTHCRLKFYTVHVHFGKEMQTGSWEILRRLRCFQITMATNAFPELAISYRVDFRSYFSRYFTHFVCNKTPSKVHLCYSYIQSCACI